MPKSVIIVGSGLTGLILGQILKNRGFSVLVVDKGRKPGGRVLSKRVGDCICDIGPGWFHTLAETTPDFLYAALAAVGAEPIAFEHLPQSVRSGLPNQPSLQSWKIPGGIRRLTDTLARPLDVLQSIRLQSIKKQDNQWLLDAVDTAHGDDPIEMLALGLVLTTPWPQALEILQKSELVHNNNITQFAHLPDYDKCLVAAFGLTDFDPATLQQTSMDMAGDAVIQRIQMEKSDSGQLTAVVHTRPDFSDRHWGEPDETVLAMIKQHAGRLLNFNLEHAPALLHRWKYATLKSANGTATQPLVISQAPPLILAGEAFGLLPEMQSGILAAQNSAKLAGGLVK